MAGRPRQIRTDNGPEFAGRALDQWCFAQGVEQHFIQPGLNENWFVSVNDARQIIEQWRRYYNQERPHSALGYRTPEEFAAEAKSFDRTGVGQGTTTNHRFGPKLRP